jgi:hypothetical protein
VFSCLAAETGEVNKPMGRLVALAAALALGVLGVVVVPTPAVACSCATMTTTQAARQADAIFRGTVTALDNEGRGDERRTDIRFAVDAVYKGTVYREQVVASARDSSACGLVPGVGSTWVIFAVAGIEGRGDDAVARLVTNTCSGNLPTGSAPVLLGKPVKPLDGSSDREERATSTDRWLSRGLAIGGIGLLSVGALAAVGVAVIWRPGRKR